MLKTVMGPRHVLLATDPTPLFPVHREAVRGPRTAPGSVWEGLPGRTHWQEGQGRTRRGDKGEQALEETGLGHLGLGTPGTSGVRDI